MTIVCVLKSGGDFGLDHVFKLADGIKRHDPDQGAVLCLTDFFNTPTSRRGTDFIPLRQSWPGWWSKLEVFRIEGPCLYLDLDTVVCGSVRGLLDLITAMEPHQLLMLRDFHHPDKLASGILGWSHSMTDLYDTFSRLSEEGRFDTSQKCRFHLHNERYRGDQDWLANRVNVRHPGRQIRAAIAQNLWPHICSYKVDCEGAAALPAGCALLCFHGKPRPDALRGDHWARRIWEGEAS